MTQPLRSTSITEASSLLRVAPPSAPHRYAHSRGVTHLNFSLIISTTGSHVPQKSLKQRHATYTPDTDQPVNRHPLDSSRTMHQDPVSMSTVAAFDASSVVRLRSSHCSSHDASHDAFSLTLTTTALNRSSSGLFEASPCRAAPEGPPPSLLELQHFKLHASWHTLHRNTSSAVGNEPPFGWV